MTLYPNGYGTQMITLERMRELHEPNMHPEFARRFFRYIESKGGLLGVGGGFRVTQPIREGFAPPGKSFHENQTFASGIVGYCAVDLVVPVPGRVHRSPTWAKCADAPQFLLHTFVTNEPWHIQPIEIRGWQTWVDAGRPDPINPNPIPDPEPEEDDDMAKIAYYALPPAGYPAGSPEFVVVDGSFRYRTNADRPGLIPDADPPVSPEQYEIMRRTIPA